mgnify:CR=1 FL=1
MILAVASVLSFVDIVVEYSIFNSGHNYLPTFFCIAQLTRALVYHDPGRRFKSRRRRNGIYGGQS